MYQIDVAGALRQGWQLAIVTRKGPERLNQLRSIGKESHLFVESPVEAGDYKIRTFFVLAAKRIERVTPSAAATSVGNQFLGFSNCVDLGGSHKNETNNGHNPNRAPREPLAFCVPQERKCRYDDQLRQRKRQDRMMNSNSAGQQQHAGGSEDQTRKQESHRSEAMLVPHKAGDGDDSNR